MLTEDKSHDLFDRIRKFSTVDEVEVHFSSIDYALTRFANNTIHQNVAELSESASIRVAFDGKTARASVDRPGGQAALHVVGQPMSARRLHPKTIRRLSIRQLLRHD